MESSPKLHKIHLTGVPETLLMTLRAKALDARAPYPILGDTTAAEWAAAVDYDFGKLAGFGDALIVVRALQLDTWAREFLRIYADATVLNLGCGLDARVFRIAPGSDVQWFDVDLPEVIEIRRKFCADRVGYRMVAASVTDPAWLAEIPAVEIQGRPVLILAEGLLEYLEEADVKALLTRLMDRFPAGEMAFDVMNAFAIKAGSKSLKETTGARHLWAVDDPAVVDRFDPRWTRLAALPLFASPFVKKLPLSGRLIYGMLRLIPRFRNMMRLLRYRF